MFQKKVLCFEGIDGSGKTTLVRILSERISCPVLVIADPGGSELGNRIRRILSDSGSTAHPWVDALLFLAGRVENIHRMILPALQQEKCVLLDRFFDSTFAYQGYGQGLNLQALKKVSDAVLEGFRPDLTFILDCPVEVAAKRIEDRPEVLSRWERLGRSFMERVRQGYLEIAGSDPDRYVVLDATADPETLCRRVLDICERLRGSS
ncbi:dTMP kinase [Thermodesulforhabdus norvegica]|uniref:Thymidylate kinase n=1 Tax=Thermodesulforhabdus norvegica TaxID=39841 RepID=A0A1I4U884_9BACT|nr:dTMP kinase [Thermodesulforhabdus norvegica]SFM85182.1 dTMP kinase [Thermodesulforhabdus norvegica]